MIRFIYIGDQITDGSKDFAFYDTVTDHFVSVDGQFVFENTQDLIHASVDSKQLARLIRLVPAEVN